jgi:hypothetical protein
MLGISILVGLVVVLFVVGIVIYFTITTAWCG